MSKAGPPNLENSNPFGDGLGPRRVRQKRSTPDSPKANSISKSQVHDQDSNAIASSSKDGGSMFQSASNIIIHGGHFLTFSADANFRPNVHDPQSDGESIAIKDESDKEMYPSEAIQKGNGKEKRGVKRSAAELSFDSDCDVIDLGPIRRSSDIYYHHIGAKGRGSPLWIPEPNKNLHIDYQRQGLAIGDVGIITASGSFDFLFNICLPANHPFNPKQLPDNFVPLSIELEDIQKRSEFKGENYLSSASVRKSHRRGDSSGLIFEAEASEGAILTMPAGLNSEDLGNIRRIRKYAGSNAEHWYRYINDFRGREAQNGDVRVVVGHDKTMAWGIATFSNLTTQKDPFQLIFRPVEQRSVGRTYEWEHSGMAEVRAGPGASEIGALRKDDPAQQGAEYENQCLFVRTLNIKLRDDIWQKLESELGEVEVAGDPGYTCSDPLFSAPISPARSSVSSAQPSVPGASDTHSPHLSTLTTAMIGHPSGIINDMLLKLHPDARLAITEDQDWISVLKEDDFILPLPDEIYARIIKSFTVHSEEDIVFLEEMDKQLPAELAAPQVSSLSTVSRLEARLQDLENPESSTVPAPLSEPPPSSSILANISDSSKDSKQASTKGARPLKRQKACMSCRFLKIKCDGKKPICGPCRAHPRDDECEYADGLGRSKTKVLEDTVSRLEARLEELENPENSTPSVLPHEPPTPEYNAVFTPLTMFSPTPTLFSPISTISKLSGSSGSSASSNRYPKAMPYLGIEEPSFGHLQASLDVFFLHAQQFGFFLHIPSFRHFALLIFPLGHPNRPTPGLLNVVHLLGIHFSRPEAFPGQESALLTRAVQHVATDLMGTHPNKVMHTLQAEILLSYYFLHTGSLLEAKCRAGTAVSLALGSGLHKIRSANFMVPSTIGILHDRPYALPPPANKLQEAERINGFWSVIMLHEFISVAMEAPARVCGGLEAPWMQIDTPWPIDMDMYEDDILLPEPQGDSTVRAFLNGSLQDQGGSSTASVAKATVLFHQASHVTGQWSPNMSQKDNMAYDAAAKSVNTLVDNFRATLAPIPHEVIRDSSIRTTLLIHALVDAASIKMHWVSSYACPESKQICLTAARNMVNYGELNLQDFGLVNPIMGNLWMTACLVFVDEISRTRHVGSTAPEVEDELIESYRNGLNAMGLFSQESILMRYQLTKVQEAYDAI